MSLAGCQINPIDVKFTPPKKFANFNKNQADKMWSKKDKEVERALPCANQGLDIIDRP